MLNASHVPGQHVKLHVNRRGRPSPPPAELMFRIPDTRRGLHQHAFHMGIREGKREGRKGGGRDGRDRERERERERGERRRLARFKSMQVFS